MELAGSPCPPRCFHLPGATCRVRRCLVVQAVFGRARLFYAAAARADHAHAWIRQHAVTLSSDGSGEGIQSGRLDSAAVKPLGRRRSLGISENRQGAVDACEALQTKWRVNQRAQTDFWSCCANVIAPTKFLRDHWPLEMFEELRELSLTDFGDETDNAFATHCLEFPIFRYLDSG